MNQANTLKFSSSQNQSAKLLKSILEEVRLLRNEMMIFFPQDRLKDYAHPDRIKRSYEKALKQYPRSSLLCSGKSFSRKLA